jgi:hypothetical protein
MRSAHALTAVAVMLILAPAVGAQAVPPFFGRGVAAFNPQISVVNSGTLLDVQATVSHDRRYVTITTRPQSTQLLEMRTFAFQGGMPGGFVGGATPTGMPALAVAPDRTSPTAIQRQVEQAESVLNKQGMFLIHPLQSSE